MKKDREDANNLLTVGKNLGVSMAEKHTAMVEKLVFMEPWDINRPESWKVCYKHGG